MSDHLLFG